MGITTCFQQIYNEDINDLLAPENTKLPVHEHKDGSINVGGLREDIVSSPNHVLQLLSEGEQHRHVGETKMNKSSSRSHTIFRMVVESRSTIPSPAGDGAIRVSHLTLVDLAGSERIAKTGAEGQRKKEGAAINKSLLTLGTVINKLSEGVAAVGGHIPYRDSKLTRILQPSLGGNAKTAVICAVTPAAQHVEESHSTLRFACRAKRVVNNATVNEVLSDAALLKRQATEIEELRKMLATNTGSVNSKKSAGDEIDRLRAELLKKDKEKDSALAALASEKEERERVQRRMDTMARLIGVDASDGDEKAMATMMPGAESGSRMDQVTRQNSRRRETWCPGDSGNASANVNSRRSSPPRKKVRHSVECDVAAHEACTDAMADVAAEVSEVEEITDVPSLHARLRQLITARALMHQELDASYIAAQRIRHQLRTAENELVSLASEKDKAGVSLKEAQWKARHMEREAAEAALERDAARESKKELESTVQQLKEQLAESGDEVQQRLRAAMEEVTTLKLQAEIAHGTKLAFEEAMLEKERLEGKFLKIKAAVGEAEDKAKQHAAELGDAMKSTKAAEERAEKAEARSRELYEETQRLAAHIKDLESRKRAPLYQKKQEEELRAVKEKATEADVRAMEADMKAREAASALEDAQRTVTVLQEELEKAKQASMEELADAKEAMELAIQRSAAEAELLSTRHAEALAAAKVKEDAALAAKGAAEATLAEQSQEIVALHEEIASLKETIEALQSQMEETQACADAAAEHVRFLEEKQEAELAAVEEEKKVMESKADELRAALDAAALEKEAMAGVSAALEKAKEELEVKVTIAAGAIHAAEELKELRRKYKDEVARLNQALKSATAGSKGTEKAADRAAKETERLRNQIKEVEGKLRTAVAEKTSAQLEKAAVERELRAAKAQLEKSNKNVSRIANIEEKKRDTIMTDFNHMKEKLSATEDMLSTVQAELYECKTELDSSNDRAEALAKRADYEHGRANDAEEKNEILEERVGHLEEREKYLERTLEENDHEQNILKSKLEEAHCDLKKFRTQTIQLKQEIEQLEDAQAVLVHEKKVKEQILSEERARVDTLTLQSKATEERLTAEAAALTCQLEAHCQEINALQADAHQRDEELQLLRGELAALQTQLSELQAQRDDAQLQLNTAEAKLAEERLILSEKNAQLQSTIQERQEYISSLETQMNDIMADNMEGKATLESATLQCAHAEKELKELREELEHVQDQAEHRAAELQQSKETVDMLENSLDEARTRAETMKHALEETEKRAHTAEERSNELLAQSTALESRLAAVNAEMNQMCHDLEKKVCTANESAEKWKSLVETMQEDQAMGEKAKIQLESTITELQQQLDSEQKLIESGSLEVDRLREEVDGVRRDMEVIIAQHAQHKAEMHEEFEKKISSLSTALQQLETQVQQSRAEAEMLQQKLQESTEQSNVHQENTEASESIRKRCSALEQELRKSKRREEKLQALQFRLREDLAKAGGDVSFFDKLKDVRSLEYELDRALNKAAKEKAVLQEALREARRSKGMGGGNPTAVVHPLGELNKENINHF